MKTLLLLTATLMLGGHSLWGQTNLPYVVDFTEEIPSDWMIPSSDTLEWEYRADIGNTAPGSAIIDLGTTSDPAYAGILTPWLNLSSVEKPVLRFHVAVVKNNFIAPGLSLWYDDGTGLKYMDSWGTNLFQVEKAITGSVDLQPPLDGTALNWNAVEMDLSDLPSPANVQFLFRADFSNGGWALIDDIEFVDASVSGVVESPEQVDIRLVPNPVTSILSVESDGTVRRVDILNSLGQMVLSREVGSAGPLDVDVADLVPGMYWLRLTDAEGNSSTRSFVRMSGM